jgi:hypothetical protein
MYQNDSTAFTARASGRVAILSLAVALLLISVSDADGAGYFLPFHWSSHNHNGQVIEKAAILVPIRIEGSTKKLYAQLDTGADLTSFYGPALRIHGIAVDSVRHPNLRFKWYDFDGDYRSLGEHAFLRWDMGRGANPDSNDPSAHIVATIGMDQMVGRILVLDFPGARFAVLSDEAEVAALGADSIHYVNAEFSYFKFYVDVVVGEDTLRGVRYDCGASTATLILPLDVWQRSTGLTGDEDVIVRDSSWSWGRFVQLWKAPAKGDLSFGPIRLSSPEVTYIDWPDPTLRTMSFLGNAPFYDSFIVVVDCINQRFGVARPQ